MKKIYKAHILFTKEKSHFEVFENGYVAVGDDGRVIKVAADLASLDSEDAEVIDFGDRLLIPAMNDMRREHVSPLPPYPVALWDDAQLRFRHCPYGKYPPADEIVSGNRHGCPGRQGSHEPPLP